ncbi:MAG TPA: LysM peptidoglycan-binding domain-containing protein, partial [Chloroflexi bacterium]|nr:LysM peptidoglycan-binding domain-containing protein [Chloroflexota bacterium]
MSSIAVQYGVSSQAIAEANGMRLTSLLSIGQQLIIPGVQPTPAPTEVPSEVPPTTTPEPTVAATSTAAKFAYRAPVLLSPTNGMLISGRDTPVMLTWASVGILGRDEWYLLRIWTPDSPTQPIRVWTKATSYRVPRGLYPGDRRTHRLSWQ